MKHSAADVAGFARVVADVLAEHPGSIERFLDDGDQADDDGGACDG